MHAALTASDTGSAMAAGRTRACTHKNMTMNLELIDSWDKFLHLQHEWDALLEESDANNLFVTWEWMESWINVNGKDHQPYTIVARDHDNRLIGVAPLYAASMRLLNMLPYRALQIIGDANSGAEYPDWPAMRSREHEIKSGIARALSRTYTRWDLLWIPNLAGWENGIETLKGALENAGLQHHLRERHFCAFELPASYEDYLTGHLSGMQRYNVRRLEKKFGACADISITRCNAHTDIPSILESLFELHKLRWNSLDQDGSFMRRPKLKEFYREFVPRALTRGWLELYVLQCNGEAKAIQIGYLYKNRFYVIQEGFDPNFKPGAGNYLRSHVIRSCIERKAGCYDFLGDYSEHKQRWGGKLRTGYDLLAFRNNLKTLPLNYFKLWPTGKYLKPAM